MDYTATGVVHCIEDEYGNKVSSVFARKVVKSHLGPRKKKKSDGMNQINYFKSFINFCIL